MPDFQKTFFVGPHKATTSFSIAPHPADATLGMFSRVVISLDSPSLAGMKDVPQLHSRERADLNRQIFEYAQSQATGFAKLEPITEPAPIPGAF